MMININSILLTNWHLGIIVTIIGYVTVIVALLLLWGFYSLVPKILDKFNKIKLKKKNKHKIEEIINNEISGEIVVAIGTALYHYLNELHEEESGKITIKRIAKSYSPWSSKIYGVNRRL